MIRKLAWLALIAGFMALVVHAATSDTGLVGWLNALQQRWAGAYSRKLSFFVLMVCGMLLAGPLAIWLQVSGPPSVTAPIADMGPASDADHASPRASTWLLAWLVMLGLVWAAAAASALWSHWQQSSDARATYTPLTLVRVTGSLPGAATHLALHGRLLWDHSVQRRQKSGDRIDHHLVPIVARDWQEGDAVEVVAKLAPSEVPPLERSPGWRSGSLFVRVDGGVPTIAADVFQRLGAPLAPQPVLVAVVAGGDERPGAQALAVDWEGAQIWGVLGTIIATFSVGLLAVLMRRRGGS